MRWRPITRGLDWRDVVRILAKMEHHTLSSMSYALGLQRFSMSKRLSKGSKTSVDALLEMLDELNARLVIEWDHPGNRLMDRRFELNCVTAEIPARVKKELEAATYHKRK
jgi:hypothetical protein